MFDGLFEELGLVFVCFDFICFHFQTTAVAADVAIRSVFKMYVLYAGPKHAMRVKVKHDSMTKKHNQS